MKRGVRFVALIALLAVLLGVPLYKYFYKVDYQPLRLRDSIIDKTFSNYGPQAIKYGESYQLPPEYLLSLIVLESSGRKIVPQRFERHVFQKLKRVQLGEIDAYEGLSQANLQNLEDGDLKRLASSWGPFQIMGYKSFEIGVDVQELQGKRAVEHGCKWIDKNYGEVLRESRYKDAFHIHNTGKAYPSVGPPKTYHPEYVANGMAQMQEFAHLIDSIKEAL